MIQVFTDDDIEINLVIRDLRSTIKPLNLIIDRDTEHRLRTQLATYYSGNRCSFTPNWGLYVGYTAHFKDNDEMFDMLSNVLSTVVTAKLDSLKTLTHKLGLK